MKSNILLIGENHSGGYNYKEIIKKRKIKPSLLLVEGPFEKETSLDNVLLDFKISCDVKLPEFLFPFIEEKDKTKFLKDRKIPNETEIKGLWNPEKRIFLESINEMCSEYYKLGSNHWNMFNDEIEAINSIEKTFTIAYPLLLKLSKNIKKSERNYLKWEVDQVKGIINKIKEIKSDMNKMDEILYFEYVQRNEIFERQRNVLSFSTNNKIFLETILENLQPQMAVIVGANHVNYLSKWLKRHNHEVSEEIVG